jgi:dipeptidyl-peptidase-4
VRQLMVMVLVAWSLMGLTASAVAPEDPGRAEAAPPARAAMPDEVENGKEKDQAGEADEAKAEDEKKKEDELTLERLFPEKSFFGPSAGHMSFSRDGRYAAYLYRPYIERRHGSDLWIYDVQTGESRRITSVSVMSKFQEATRKVREDRIKKAEKRRKEKAGEKGKDEEKDKHAPVGDLVSGEWSGILFGEEEYGIPPEGVAFLLTLMLGEDNAVDGTFRSAVADATITEGLFDVEKKELTCTLVDPDSGLTGALSATIEADSMEGVITTEDPAATFEITAERRPAAVEEQDDRDEDEKVDQDREGNGGEDDEVDAGDSGQEDDEGDKGKEVDDGDEGEGEGEGDDEKKIDLGDVVDDKDADDEKAPRYGGISTYTWAPEAAELMFVAGGDVYRYDVENDAITRLTKTRDRKRGVEYLPDGTGYTFMQGNSVMKVTFGSHLVEQIDPSFAGGEEMRSYRMSEDGTRLAFVTSKGADSRGGGRSVNIVNYRQRFAEVRQVPRHMPDDPRPKVETSVYLYEINDPMAEEGKLSKVFGFTQTGPRDTLQGPEWALDSSRIAFLVFEQSSNLVRIFEAAFPEKKQAAEGEQASEKKEDGKKDEDAEKADDDDAKPDRKKGEKKKDDEPKVEEARIVYQFYHNGGPNTPGMMRPFYLADSRRMALITELSGFRHVHVLDPLYEQLEQITHGRFEVYPAGLSKDHKLMFITATKEHPAQLDIYRIDLDTFDMTRLSKVDGYYSREAVSNDGAHVLATFVDYGCLPELVAINAAEEGQKTLTDSHPEEAHKLTKPVPEFFTYKNRHGQDIYGHMFKPDDWTPDDKRPLLMYVYGGPLGTRKMVTRGSYASDSYFLAYYMAKKHGYITCTVDPRGASGYGGLYEKSNYEQVGKPQVEDLVDGAKWFVENHGVDEKRIGLHGWSFGGFQTQMCLYTEPDVFACGIAGAGPTEWENYNSWYATATIGPSREGQTDLAKFSLLPLAKNLKAKLLLVHGMEDSNVLYQDTVRVYRELLKAGKETLVELFLDPTGGHGLGGDVKRLGRMRKYEEFLLRTLGPGAPGAPPEVEEEEAEEEAAAEEVHDEAPPAPDDDDGWIVLFNGEDLTGWTPKFAGHELGVNYNDTFRVEDGAIIVNYDEWEHFDGEFGHLFYEQEYSHYILQLEYRFTGEQTPGGPAWAYRNSGVMIHGQRPEKMRIDQDFPVCVEVQLLGGDGEHERHTANVCTPGTTIVIDGELTTAHCVDSTSQTYHGDDWVAVEVEVHGGEVVRHKINGEIVLEYGAPQLDESDADALAWIDQRGGEKMLTSGTISLQAESHPCAFRSIRLKPLGE